jgi:uncharacterized protein (TIGR02596 family)
MIITRRAVHSKTFPAYTLVEMIVVSGIIVLLVSLAVPSVLDLLKSMRMTHAAHKVQECLTQAQGMATSFNRDVEVRLYRTGGSLYSGEASGHGIQLFKISGDANPKVSEVQMTPEGAEEILPVSVQFSLNESFSSIWKLAVRGEKAQKGLREYVAFRYRPDGSTDLPEDQKWSLSLVPHPADVSSNLPANFVVFMIDPVTGHLSSFRPD